MKGTSQIAVVHLEETENIIEMCKEHKVSKLVYCSSTGAIPEEEKGTIRECEGSIPLDPERIKAIIGSLEDEIKKIEDMGRTPIVVTSPIVRMYFKSMTQDYIKDLIVVSYNEIDSNVELSSVGMVTG